MDKKVTKHCPDSLDLSQGSNLWMNILRTVEKDLRNLHFESNHTCICCHPAQRNIIGHHQQALTNRFPMHGFNESNFIPLRNSEGSPSCKKKNFQTTNEDGSVSPPHGGKKRRENISLGRTRKLDRYVRSTASPWVTRDYHPGLVGFHEEIEDFYELMRPTEEERQMREYVIKSVEEVVLELWPTCKLDVFGSFRTDLYLPTSDIDIVLFGEWEHLPLWSLQKALVSKDIVAEGSVKVLDRAAVPLIKFQHKETLVKVDISFNIQSGVQSVELIKDFMKKYPALPKLIFVLKQFLLVRELNEVWTGGLSSYSLILMAISFLQTHPRSDSRDITNNLGVMLLEFLELYGRHFNYQSLCICVKNKGYITKEEFRKQMDNGCQPSLLSIEDPLTLGNDLGRGSYAVMQVKQAFEFSFRTLTNAIFHLNFNGNQPSLLSLIVYVPYDIMEYRRMAVAKWRDYVSSTTDTGNLQHQNGGYCSTSSACSTDSCSDATPDARYNSSESSLCTTDSDSESLLEDLCSPIPRRPVVHSKSSDCLSSLGDQKNSAPKSRDAERTHSADNRSLSADRKLASLPINAQKSSKPQTPALVTPCKNVKTETVANNVTSKEKRKDGNSGTSKSSTSTAKNSPAPRRKIERNTASLISFTSSKNQPEVKHQTRRNGPSRRGNNSSSSRNHDNRKPTNRVNSVGNANEFSADR
ncbi:uncharacterized protein LOC101243288 isoform X2 [Ciona intestinalis]